MEKMHKSSEQTSGFTAMCCGRPMIVFREGDKLILKCSTGSHGRWFTISEQSQGPATCSCWSGQGKLDVADLGSVRLYECIQCGARYTVFVDGVRAEASIHGINPDEVSKVGKEAISAFWDTLYDHRNQGRGISPKEVDGFVAQVRKLRADIENTSKDEPIDDLVTFVRSNLRASIFETPTREKQIQDALEVMLRSKGLDYKREKERIVYSTTSFVPDFTIESLDVAIEVKLCRAGDKERLIVNEINADIPAYQSRFGRCLFIVYDLGFIRDVGQFTSSIGLNPNIDILVVKH